MRMNSSVVLAVIIAVAAGAWVLSGQFADRPATAADPAHSPTDTAAPAPTRVRVVTSTAEEFVPVVRVSGQTEAARVVEVRAETEGRVAEIGAAKGSLVEAGDLILQLDPADRPAQLQRARARTEQRRIEYEAARTLAAQGHQAETRRAQALADYEEARAVQAQIQVDVDRTRITAPFRAVLDRRHSEVGDYLKIADPVATLVELDPLRVVAQVPQSQAPALAEGMTGVARLADGHDRPAIVIYTAAVADAATRTFRVEAEIANPEGRIGQGMTAELRLPLPARPAHRVSPSTFLLDADGQVGVVIVDDNDTARFRRIIVLGADGGGAWVSGLPDRTRIITVGQQLVTDGEPVEPVEIEAGAPQS